MQMQCLFLQIEEQLYLLIHNMTQTLPVDS